MKEFAGKALRRSWRVFAQTAFFESHPHKILRSLEQAVAAIRVDAS
jgi:hypothetical protein